MFDVFNIFFLVLAIVIFVMLRNALGRRTGHERPPFDPYSGPEARTDEKVINLPGTRRAPSEANDNVPEAETEPEAAQPALDKYAAPDSPAAAGLKAIAAVDRSFNPGEFLDGARGAYEMVVTAFADADRPTLRNLLSPAVHDGFIDAIEAREDRGEQMESKFVGINAADIVDAALKGRAAQITVRFRSQLVSATRSAAGDVVDGDPTAVRDVNDIWTFERDTTSRDPNWKLAATEAAR